jgi:hypothetical protein
MLRQPRLLRRSGLGFERLGRQRSLPHLTTPSSERYGMSTATVLAIFLVYEASEFSGHCALLSRGRECHLIQDCSEARIAGEAWNEPAADLHEHYIR